MINFIQIVFEYTSLPKNIKQKNIIDSPMYLSLPYQKSVLRYFNDIDQCSYIDNNGECVLKTIYDVLNRDRKHFSFQFLRDKFNKACIFSKRYRYKKKRGQVLSLILM